MINSQFLDPFFNPLPLETAQVGTYGARLTSENGIIGLEHGAYPNPFSEATKISFTVPEVTDVKVEVFNLTGTKVGSLFNDVAEANRTYELDFNAGDNGSGIYFYRITTSKGKMATGRLVIQK